MGEVGEIGSWMYSGDINTALPLTHPFSRLYSYIIPISSLNNTLTFDALTHHSLFTPHTSHQTKQCPESTNVKSLSRLNSRRYHISLALRLTRPSLVSLSLTLILTTHTGRPRPRTNPLQTNDPSLLKHRSILKLRLHKHRSCRSPYYCKPTSTGSGFREGYGQ